MKATLVPNIVGFPSYSMVRYAEDLSVALRQIAPPDWEFEMLQGLPLAAIKRLLPGAQGEKWAGRIGRFVTYPSQAARSVADVYHVLDHSHANIIRSLPADKTVITCHDVIPLLGAKGQIPVSVGRATRYTFPLRIQLMRRCRYILADSESTRQDLMEHGSVPAEQIVVSHLGVKPAFLEEATDRSEKTRAIRRRLEIPEDAQVVVHVGNTERYKNTPTVLRALKRLTEDYEVGKHIYLLRLGSPLREDETELAASLGISERIKWAGSVRGDAAFADHYRSGDVLAAPSIYEGFGWPPLEAMASGVPVVASKVASLPEIVGDAGLMVSPMDDEALATCLHQILTVHKLRDTLIARGKKRASAFTWENCARRVLSVYENLYGVGKIT